MYTMNTYALYYSYGIMTSCWTVNPKDRPAFSKLSKQLHSLLDGSSRRKERKSLGKKLKQFSRRK